MAENKNRAYLGRGWSFPPNFLVTPGKVTMVQEEEDIQQSLHILLGTRPGERPLQPDFGCNLDVMLFEPLTTTLITIVKDLIRTAILYFEPRIDLLSVSIDTRDALAGQVLIELSYLVRSTNSRFNFVYPFYLEEASSQPTS
jgi:phage baseplate assembly protein W